MSRFLSQAGNLSVTTPPPRRSTQGEKSTDEKGRQRRRCSRKQTPEGKQNAQAVLQVLSGRGLPPSRELLSSPQTLVRSSTASKVISLCDVLAQARARYEASVASSDAPSVVTSCSAQSSALVPGMIVVFCGLRKAVKWNGRRGVLEFFDTTTGRWIVRCDDGMGKEELRNVRPHNMSPADGHVKTNPTCTISARGKNVQELEVTTVALAAGSGFAGHTCHRCLGNLCSGPVLRCMDCSDVIHSQCAYPPMSEAACRTIDAQNWLCEVCLQVRCLRESTLEKNYRFCLACCSQEGSEPVLGLDLLTCYSCRASYHPGCLGLSKPTGRHSWQCLECTLRPDKPTVTLAKWSLELLRQPSGRLVPLVRGTRSDLETPAGSLWRTAEIVHAVSATVLVTRTRMMVTLSGKMSKTLARKLKLPNSLIQHFHNGFPPESWMALVRFCDQGVPLDISKAIQQQHVAAPTPLSDASAVRQAMREVRPSAKHFWDEISRRVGKSVEECQAIANSIAGSPAPTKRRLERSPAKIKDDEANENPLPLVMANLPHKDGPARAKKVRKIMGIRCFRDSHDFLDLAPSGTVMPPQQDFISPQRIPVIAGSAGLQTAQAHQERSPASLSFLSSLHTGCTPTSGKKVFVSRRLFGESPPPSALCPGLGSPPCRGDDREDPVWNALHDIGDVSWQPKGIDGFICETRARRGRLAKKSKASAVSRVPPEAELKHRQQLRRAPALFRRVDAQLAREAAMECAPPSCSEDSEDEMAPIAYVPLCS